MKQYFFILIFVILGSFAYGLECKDILTPSEIPCTIKSTWTYADCNTTEVKVYNTTPELLFITNFSNYGDTGRCNITWNISTVGSYFYNVSNGDTGTIIVQNEVDDMASFGIMLFLMVITAAIFLVGKNTVFTKNVTLAFIIKRSLYLVGIFMITICMTAAFTFVKLYSLGLENEFRMLLWVTTFGAYIFEIVLLFSTMIIGLKLWKIEKTNRRMSNDG